MSGGLRIGTVPYLNALPFVSALSAMNVASVHPSSLAPMLRRDEVNIALVPVFEYLARPDLYAVLDGWCIGSCGEVLSVFVAHHRPMPEVKTVWLDTASLTSVNLFRVLAARHWKIQPEYVADAETSDAEVWIGDQALRFITDHPEVTRSDLGKMWMDFTGLPFVFAVWAVRKDALHLKDELEHLRALLAEGVGNRLRLASTPQEREYLGNKISYELDDEKKRGLARFRKELEEVRLIAPSPAPIKFV